jgi:hypothetical protein
MSGRRWAVSLRKLLVVVRQRVSSAVAWMLRIGLPGMSSALGILTANSST